LKHVAQFVFFSPSIIDYCLWNAFFFHECIMPPPLLKPIQISTSIYCVDVVEFQKITGSYIYIYIYIFFLVVGYMINLKNNKFHFQTVIRCYTVTVVNIYP
jgi:hypothetical protein